MDDNLKRNFYEDTQEINVAFLTISNDTRENNKKGKEKNKKRSDTLWGLVWHACSKTAHSGNRGTSDRRVFHAFCDHDDCCWTDQQKNKLGNDLLYGLAAHCISLYQYYLEQSTSRFCH